MLTAGPARKVTIHVSENHKYHGQSAYAAILDFLFYRAVSGATVVRGIAGLRPKKRRSHQRLL
jgi:PII-like signaling protein